MGAAGCGPQGRLAGRRLVSGGPADQHDHRDLGPAAAARAGAGDRPDQGRGRAAVRRQPSSASPTSPSRAATTSRWSRPTPTSDGAPGATTAASGCCAAATTSSTAATGWAGWTPDCSSSPSFGDPRTHFIPIQTRLGLGDGLSEYIQHTGSALFAVPPGIARASTSARPCSPRSGAGRSRTHRGRRFSAQGHECCPDSTIRAAFPAHGYE